MSKNDSSAPAAKAAKKKKPKINKLAFIVAALLIVIAVGGYLAYDKYSELQRENQRLSDPQEAARTEAERIKHEISQLIEVPQDESPTIATVVDPTKLGDQAFFSKAQKDDRVVIYAQAKKAILYRPSTKKIIEVAPLNIGEGTAEEKAGSTSQTTEEDDTAPGTEPGL